MRPITRITTGVGIAGVMTAMALTMPQAAQAAPTECEPGSTSYTFSSHSAEKEVAGTTRITNDGTKTRPVSVKAEISESFTATVSASVSVDSVLSPVKAELSASASKSESITSGASVGKVNLKAGETVRVTYGFETVEFSGKRTTCQSNGKVGEPVYFSGTAPTGTYYSVT